MAWGPDRNVLRLSHFHFSDLKFINKTFNEVTFCEREIGVQSVLLSRHNAIAVQLKDVCVRRISSFACWLSRDFGDQRGDMAP